MYLCYINNDRSLPSSFILCFLSLRLSPSHFSPLSLSLSLFLTGVLCEYGRFACSTHSRTFSRSLAPVLYIFVYSIFVCSIFISTQYLFLICFYSSCRGLLLLSLFSIFTFIKKNAFYNSREASLVKCEVYLRTKCELFF